MYEDEEEQEEGPKSSFTTYLAEGDVLFKQGEYKKSLDSYNLALELKPTEKFALVARSRCHLQLGDTASALKDAETALEEDKEFIRALYQKAEALYSMGDFEHALVFYHRGNKLRPEQQEFRLGIQKAQEAIDNSIGRAAKIKLENKGDLSFFAKQDEVKKPKGYIKPKAAHNRNQQQQQSNRGKNTKPPAASTKTVKQLLGELYADKQYLENLLEDRDFIQGNNHSVIHGLISGGINYLDSRTEFWRQQKPLYARKKEKPTPHRHKPKPKASDPTDFIVRSLEEIDQKLAEGDEQGNLKQAENTLRTVKSMNEKDIPNKQEVIANLHSCIGNAHLEMDDATKALESHKRDLTISKKIESKDGISRALDNIGRCHARLGQYAQAIDSWTEKLPLSKTPLETTWLHHEIGRCYLEQKSFQDALECGERSLTSAQEAKEQVWELNATVLIAQAQVKLDDLQASLKSFQNAHEIAMLLDDNAAATAVAKAIDDVNERIAKDAREDSETQDGNEESEKQLEEEEKRSEYDDGVKSEEDKQEEKEYEYKEEEYGDKEDKQDDKEKEYEYKEVEYGDKDDTDGHLGEPGNDGEHREENRENDDTEPVGTVKEESAGIKNEDSGATTTDQALSGDTNKDGAGTTTNQDSGDTTNPDPAGTTNKDLGE